ncbi:UDP-N-acetylmuramate--L-alanine ligase [bacterium]|nr:UDP-N-acetylmuramate--L-alanine ligase [bacterium]MBU1983092.1 UDP-N-acetylmuramate--L-alanine ligase [bacterium]
MSGLRPFRRVRQVHMIGIGGAGMSGIAEVLLNLGFVVTGSDLQLSEVTERLQRLGARIAKGHSSDNVAGADVVVYSSAVKPENVEIRTARSQGIPQIPRSEMLAELMRLKVGVAISGTHGKTTTTSMIGAILQRAERNPTLIVGGIVRALGSGVKMGSGELLVVEADEFDRSFLKLNPTIAAITTIEPEHLDTYTDLPNLQDAFVEFANHVPFYGAVVVCADEPNIQAILPRIKRPIVSYGFGKACEIRALDVEQMGYRTRFQFTMFDDTQRECELQVPGRHNVLNALAAVAIAYELDVSFDVTCAALAEFTGVHRRFEIKGEARGVIVVDDYAHHPTEVRSTLTTARRCWPEKRIVALFQPHLFTRTRDFAREFGIALSEADVILIADIYPARERPIPGITAELIAKSIERGDVHLVGPQPSARKILEHTQPGDVLIVMGAGDITRTAQEIMTLNDASKRS